MRFANKPLIIGLSLAGLLFSATSLKGVTLSELRNAPDLTPERFARYFAGFKFQFLEEVQDHDAFLSRKTGDCDDYATLAADVLSRHGYTTRLIAVRMKGETHVVCYVAETKSYLDYNCRHDEHPLISSSGNLTEIARKVADSFGKDWLAAYEFTYREGVKRLVQNIVPNRSVNRTKNS